MKRFLGGLLAVLAVSGPLALSASAGGTRPAVGESSTTEPSGSSTTSTTTTTELPATSSTSTSTTSTSTALATSTSISSTTSSTSTSSTTSISSTTTTTTIPIVAPSAPLSLIALSRDRAAALRWSVPASTGGAPTVSYVVERDVGFGFVRIGTTTSTTYYSTGLVNLEVVGFRVAARNSAGTSPFSSIVLVRPYDLTPPRLATVASRKNALFVEWAWAGGPPLGYRVERRAVGSTSWVHVGTTGLNATRFVIQNLVNGRAYDVRVGAIYEGGPAKYSDVLRGTPGTRPAAPTGLRLVAGPAFVTALWGTSPDNGGATITSYRLQLSLNGTTWKDCCATDSVTPASILTTVRRAGFPVRPGRRMYARVAAINAIGVGTYSPAASVFVYDYPDPPAYFDVFPGNRSAFVSWDSPSYTGYAPIRNYQVQIHAVGTTTWTTVASLTGHSFTIGGLTNGTRYCVRAISWNTAGYGNATYRISFIAGTWSGYDPYGEACYS